MNIQRVRDGVKGQTFTRSFAIGERVVDEERRLVEVAFSSETDTVERSFGTEILDHSRGAVRLGRLESGGAVLYNHDHGALVGVVESARVDSDKVGRARLRFGQSAKAQEVFRDIVDGILKHVSVGYTIHDIAQDRSQDKESPVFRVTDWEPFEVSMVPVPADATVGVGRNLDYLYGGGVKMEKNDVLTEEENNEERAILKGKTRVDSREQGDTKEGVDLAQTVADTRKAEVDRMRDIKAICKQAGERGVALEERAILQGWSTDETRKRIFDIIVKPEPLPLKDMELGASEREIKSYSFLRAIAAAAEKDWSLAPMEKEMSDTVAQKLGSPARSFFIPMDVLRGATVMQRAPLTTATVGGATEWVGTNLMAGSSFIDYLINLMMTQRLGAQVLSGLSGNISISKKTGHAQASWIAENVDAPESQLSSGQVPMAPKTVGAWTEITRKLMLQSSPDVENMVRKDLAEAVALAIDLAALNGSGSGAEPLGILNQVGLAIVPIATDGGAPTWGHIVDLETQVAIDNADIGALAYLTNAQGRGKLKQTEQNPSGPAGNYIWKDSPERAFGTVNGYRAAASNQVPSTLTKGIGTGLSAAIFGNWSDLVIGQWGFMDVLVDPYSQSKKGNVVVTVHQDVDIAVRRVESFAAIVDMVTT